MQASSKGQIVGIVQLLLQAHPSQCVLVMCNIWADVSPCRRVTYQEVAQAGHTASRVNSQITHCFRSEVVCPTRTPRTDLDLALLLGAGQFQTISALLGMQTMFSVSSQEGSRGQL